MIYVFKLKMCLGTSWIVSLIILWLFCYKNTRRLIHFIIFYVPLNQSKYIISQISKSKNPSSPKLSRNFLIFDSICLFVLCWLTRRTSCLRIGKTGNGHSRRHSFEQEGQTMRQCIKHWQENIYPNLHGIIAYIDVP